MFSTEISTFSHRGWRFSSFRGPIGTHAELESLIGQLGFADVQRGHTTRSTPGPSLPEETHSNSFIEIACNGFCLRVDALGALRRWDALQKKTYPQPSIFAYDWTYSTDYGGSLTLLPSSAIEGSRMHPEPGFACATSDVPDAFPLPPPHRWCVSHSGLPLARLLKREPILYYAEVVLYSGAFNDEPLRVDHSTSHAPMPAVDDLHDRGHVEVTAKVRVMPSCCLLLCRAFLRIDGVRAVLHDARWFIDFDLEAEARERELVPACLQAHAVVEQTTSACPSLGEWQAVRPRPTAAADAPAAGTGSDAAAVYALVLYNEQQRGGPMHAIREELGLPPLQFTSPMMRADAALAKAGVERSATADLSLSGSACDAPRALEESTGDADPPPLGGFGWAVDAEAISTLSPCEAERTWALRLRVAD